MNLKRQIRATPISYDLAVFQPSADSAQRPRSLNFAPGSSLMSACIVAAQIVMVPMAMLVGAKADAWGRKPLFLLGLLILPIRGVLYTLSDNAYWLVAVQL